LIAKLNSSVKECWKVLEISVTDSD